MLRVTLLLAGFHVGVGQAIGDKEETTIASNTPALLSQPLDRGWLKRAAASTSAEPLHVSSYRQAPLTRESLDQLLAHPQFRHLEPADFQIVKDAGAKRAIAATGGR